MLVLPIEQAEPGGMNRKPYEPNESIFGRGLARHIVIVGILLGVTGLLLGLWAFNNYQNGVPTFAGIARRKSTTAMSLRVFLQSPHARMPDLHLSRDEIADVSAYILSLRSR